VKLRVRVKYCGGCNPNYDRIALAQKIKDTLPDNIEIVSSNADDYDLVVVIQGCETACADLSAFQGCPIHSLTCMEDAESLMERIRSKATA
jgi:hypothetical protein